MAAIQEGPDLVTEPDAETQNQQTEPAGGHDGEPRHPLTAIIAAATARLEEDDRAMRVAQLPFNDAAAAGRNADRLFDKKSTVHTEVEQVAAQLGATVAKVGELERNLSQSELDRIADASEQLSRLEAHSLQAAAFAAAAQKKLTSAAANAKRSCIKFNRPIEAKHAAISARAAAAQYMPVQQPHAGARTTPRYRDMVTAIIHEKRLFNVRTEVGEAHSAQPMDQDSAGSDFGDNLMKEPSSLHQDPAQPKEICLYLRYSTS